MFVSFLVFMLSFSAEPTRRFYPGDGFAGVRADFDLSEVKISSHESGADVSYHSQGTDCRISLVVGEDGFLELCEAGNGVCYNGSC
jgi:hypothetical protein